MDLTIKIRIKKKRLIKAESNIIKQNAKTTVPVLLINDSVKFPIHKVDKLKIKNNSIIIKKPFHADKTSDLLNVIELPIEKRA